MSTPRRNDLQKLPTAIRGEIGSFMPPSTLGLFAQTAREHKIETTFLRLLPAAIHAAPDKKDVTALASIAILKKHPELLFRKNMVTDHYDRKIFASPYQIFHAAGDVWALRQIHEDILPRIPDERKEVEAQFREQFPNCPWPLPENLSEEMLYDDRNEQQIKDIVKQLAVVKALIEADPFNNGNPLDTTVQAVETLCKLFQPKPGDVIKSGLHFPFAIMNEIYKTYHALYGRSSFFFSLAVIKPALDALSTVDGQCCQGGLININMEKGPNRRCHPSYQHPLGRPLFLTLANDKDKRHAAVVDPYDGEVLFSSSAHGFFDCIDKNGVSAPGGIARAHPVLVAYWETYGEQKQRLIAAIMRPSSKKSTPQFDHRDQPNRCVIL